MSEYPPERNGERRNSGIESTPPMFARSLSTAAKKEPVRFAALSLSFPQNVSEEFVDAVVNALDSSEVPPDLQSLETFLSEAICTTGHLFFTCIIKTSY